MASYVTLDTPPIELEFEGTNVDLLSLGVAQISLQRIAEKVAHDLLFNEGVLAPGQRWSSYPSRWYQPEYPRFVQLEIQEARAGSFFSVLGVAVTSALSDPHVVAILDNLGANVIWAIAMAGLREIRHDLDERLIIPGRRRRGRRDPHEVEALARDIVLTSSQNPNIKAVKIRSTRNEVVIDVSFYQNR